MNKQEFLSKVKAAGIVGEGGAGFPAHVKYDASVDTVIANGCECEPLLHTDQHIMHHSGAAVARAMRTLADAVGASRVVLGIKKKHTSLISDLKQVVSPYGVELFLLDDFYPAGDEQILLREVTGRSVPPLGIPLHAGAVIANVGTLVRVDEALGGGGLHHADEALGGSAFHEKAFTDKVLTVTGEVRNPSVLSAPIGTPLVACLEACGGIVPKDPVFILGGPMMGRVVVGMTALEKESVTKTTGGLIVLESGHPLHLNATLDAHTMRRRAASACIQCRACSDLCPRGLIGHPFETHLVMRSFAAGNECSETGSLAMMCCECGACEQFACPMGMSPRRVNQAVKASLRKEGIQYTGSKQVQEDRTAWREWRRIPVPRLAARLGISQYMKLETPYIGELNPSAVSIALRQHIGAPAVPAVTVGQYVHKGDLIGEIPEGALGARIHASISGTVTGVDECVRISASSN